MKKVFFLITFLLALNILNAQNYDVINKLKSSNLTDALSLASTMNAMTKNKYSLYKSHEFEKENILMIVYKPQDASDEDIKKLTNYDSCFVVKYNIVFEGKNADLEQPGTKVYKLNTISAKYLDVFPIWKEWFNKDANEVDALKNSDMRELYDNDKGIQFLIMRYGINWILKNDK